MSLHSCERTCKGLESSAADRMIDCHEGAVVGEEPLRVTKQGQKEEYLSRQRVRL